VPVSLLPVVEFVPSAGCVWEVPVVPSVLVPVSWATAASGNAAVSRRTERRRVFMIESLSRLVKGPVNLWDRRKFQTLLR
jgi:hypothetical protein